MAETTHPLRQPGFLYFTDPWFLRPHLTMGLPFSRAA